MADVCTELDKLIVNCGKKKNNFNPSGFIFFIAKQNLLMFKCIFVVVFCTDIYVFKYTYN